MKDTPSSTGFDGMYVDSDGAPLMPLAKALKELGIARSTSYRWRDLDKLAMHKRDGRIFCQAFQVVELRTKEGANHAAAR